jgi:heme o synthase
VGLVLAGLGVLVWRVNLLTGFLVLLAAFLYVLVYTPLKRLTWLNTSLGAIPGAMPPLCGWAAATGRLDLGAAALFAILFAWQHPHFYSIAWLYRDDYRRAGFPMLSVVEPTGRRLWRLTLLFCALLIAVSLAPVALGLAGPVYAAGAVVLGLGLLAAGATVFADARRLLRASVVYLPLLLLLISLDAGL